MGEIAEMMLEGILDYQTGEYLGEAVGFPRTRENFTNHKRGIVNYLQKRGVEKSKMHSFCVNAVDFMYPKRNKTDNSWKTIAKLIQGNWDMFHRYTQKNLK